MTALDLVREAWRVKIFEHESILTITEKAYQFDVTQNSATEVKRFYSGTQINFFTYIVSMSQSLTGGVHFKDYQFPVAISYYLEVSPNGNDQEVYDVLALLDSLVRDSLGRFWDGSVDYGRAQDGPITLSQTVIDGRRVWVGTYSYTGFKTEQI